jgi:outer membrane autotransporter protein
VQLTTADNALNFNHTDATYNFNTAITGLGSVNQTGSGVTILTNTGNTYTGDTNVTGGTLRAGGANTLSNASAFNVNGGTLDLAGNSNTLASVALGGTGVVNLPGTTAGTTLTVNGAWAGSGGTLRLGSSQTVSDRLILDGAGAVASGTTNLQITGLGLGAPTTGNGIEVVSGINGADTTAQTTRDAFRLVDGHADAGAYEYRLFAGDVGGAGQNWYLRAAADEYRGETSLYAMLPEQVRQSDLAMLGNMHQRVGNAPIAYGPNTERRAWGRIISIDHDIQQTGTVSPRSTGRLNGFQTGTDVWGDEHWNTGVFVGQIDGDMDVSGFAGGVNNQGVGENSLRNRYFGVYGTWRNSDGFYADAVLQAGWLKYTASPTTGASSSGKGDSLLFSMEIGEAFDIGSNWRIEPQVQLIHQHMNLNDAEIPSALIKQDADDGWIMRIGARIEGKASTSVGMLQPYGRVNVTKSSSGTDIARFVTAGDSTDISTRTGGVSTELAFGAALALSPVTSLYGEVGQLWAVDGDTRTKGGLNGSIGIRVLW